MSKQRSVLIMIMLILVFAMIGCSDQKGEGIIAVEKTVEESEKRVIVETLTFKKVAENNLIDDDGTRNHYVYLPEGYYDNDNKYPVVYFLHGYTGSSSDFISIYNAIEEDKSLPEAIYVAVDYSNKYGGTFMEDSDITGHWETSMIEDFIPYIDEEYRTIASKEGRGLIGFSMGGYSVIKLAMGHPDMIDAVYAISPGLLIDDELQMALNIWIDRFETAYGYAFAYEVSNDVDDVSTFIPDLTLSNQDEIVDEWLKGFGHFEEKINSYQNETDKLSFIGLEVGENDTYPWIFRGTKKFHEMLEEEGVEHVYNQTSAYHELSSKSAIDAVTQILEVLKK